MLFDEKHIPTGYNGLKNIYSENLKIYVYQF